jgi:hypothetical protein
MSDVARRKVGHPESRSGLAQDDRRFGDVVAIELRLQFDDDSCCSLRIFLICMNLIGRFESAAR